MIRLRSYTSYILTSISVTQNIIKRTDFWIFRWSIVKSSHPHVRISYLANFIIKSWCTSKIICLYFKINCNSLALNSDNLNKYRIYFLHNIITSCICKRTVWHKRKSSFKSIICASAMNGNKLIYLVCDNFGHGNTLNSTIKALPVFYSIFL